MVIGIFVFVLYGLIAYGMMLNFKQSITHAANEGARAAIGVASGDANGNGIDDRVDAARTRTQDVLKGALGSKYSASDISIPNPAACDSSQPNGAQCITVTITYPYASRPIVPAAPGLGLITPSTLSSSATVALTN